MEPDFLPDSEILVLARCIPQKNFTPLHLGGCGGDLSQLRGSGASGPSTGVSGATPPKPKIDVKLPCKSIVISSQSGSFIRWMI